MYETPAGQGGCFGLQRRSPDLLRDELQSERGSKDHHDQKTGGNQPEYQKSSTVTLEER